MSTVKPKLIVFDLDYTLWPFWVDTHVTLPFKKKSNGDIVDAYNHKIKCYDEVPEILEKLYKEEYALGIASRTGEIKGAKVLVNLFGWEKYFKFQEIYPGSKVQHFNNFKKKSGFDFNEMLFFDDEHRNIIDLNTLGVKSILVQNGMTMKILRQGLKEFSNRGSKNI